LIITGAALSLIAIAIAVLPVHGVNAKQCSNGDINNGGSNDNNDQNNNSNDDGKSCNNQQDSKHTHNSVTKGTTTPFVLSMPFP
jgi:hypothetical protein